jgi:hypothetical protein
MPNSTYACGTCNGGGLVPASNCNCSNGNVHVCSPQTCPSCGGAGWKTSTYRPCR